MLRIQSYILIIRVKEPVVGEEWKATNGMRGTDTDILNLGFLACN